MISRKFSRFSQRSSRSVFARNKAAIFATFSVASLFAGQAARAVNYSYIGAGDSNWNTPGSYTTVAAGTAGTATTAYPLIGDNVLFNFAGNNHAENIFLNGNQAVNLMTFANTGTTTLLGGTLGGAAAANTLSIVSGLTINAGAGAVTIGDSGAGAPAAVNLILNAAQTFTNNSTNALTINNGVTLLSTITRGTGLTLAGPGSTIFNGVLSNGTGAGGTLNLALTGTGTVTLNGANTFTGGTTVAAGGTLNLQGSLASLVTATQSTVLLGSTTNSAASIAGGLTITSVGTTGVTTAATADIFGSITTGTTTVTGGFNLGTFTASSLTLESTGRITSVGLTSVQGSTANILGAITAGATTVTQGTLNLNYGTLDASHLTDAGILTLNASTVNLIGGTHAEVIGSTSLGSTSSFGLTTIARPSGTATLALGAITRAAGSTLNVTTGGFASTTTVNTNNILAPGNVAYAVVGTSGTTPGVSATADFAVGGGTITGYAGYTPLPTTGSGVLTTNYLLTDSGTTTGATAGTGFGTFTLKIDDTIIGQSLNIGGTTPILSLNGAGLLFVGGFDYSITGGTIRSNAGTGEAIIHQYGAGNLTISSAIAAGTFIKDGAGTLTLAGANALTGSTFINQGTLVVGATAITPFGSSATTAVYLQTGATLDVSAAPAALTINALNSVNAFSQGSVVLGANTLTLGSAAVVGSFGGTISGTGGVTKNGANTQTFLGANTYTGVTTINQGILNIGGLVNGGQASGLGASSNAAANLVFNGGTLQYNGAAPASTDRLFTLGTGGVIDSSSATGLSFVTFSNTGAIATTGTGTHVLTLTGTNGGSGAISGTLAGNNTFASLLSDGTGGATSLVKTGTGLWVVSNAASSFTGGTTVTAGRLFESAPGSLGTGLITVASSAAQLVLFNAGTYMNNLSLAGVGVNAGSGSVSSSYGALVLNNGAVQAGTVTLTADTRVSATGVFPGSTLTGTISGQVTGGFGLDIGAGGAPTGGTITLSNTNNNYTGNTSISEGGTGSGSTATLLLGASEVIPNGVGKGDLVLNGLGTTGAVNFSLNGFSETINGLTSTGSQTPKNIFNGSTTTAATLTVGDNNASANYVGSIRNGSTALLGVTKIGTGTQTFSVTSAGTAATGVGSLSYTGATVINSGTLRLDFNQVALGTTTTLFNAIVPTTALSLNGGTLAVNGRGAGATTSQIATYATGAATITLPSVAGLVGGQVISGTGITAGTTITYIDLSTNTVRLSAATTAAGNSASVSTAPLAVTTTNTTSQTLAGVTLGGGSSGVVVNDNGGGGTVLNMGNLTRNVLGSTVDFVVPAGAPSASEGVLTGTTTNTGGVLSTTTGTAYATVAGTNWAANTTVVGTGRAITAVAGTDNTYTAGTNTNVVTSGTQTGVTVNTLRFATGGANLDLSGTNTVSAGGILVTSATAANAASITSTDGTGGLAPGAGQELVIVNNGALNVGAQVVDGASGATSLSISGFGTTTFTGTNSYQGTTTLNGGVYTPGVAYTATTRPVQTVYVNGGTYDPQIPAVSASGLGNGSVVVNVNAVLAGTGVVNALPTGGSITVNGGGTVSPGGAPGTVGVLSLVATTTSFAGNALNGRATLTLDVTATTSDLLQIAGDLDLSGSLDQLVVTGTTGLGSYKLVSFTGTRTGTFDAVTVPTGYQVAYVDPANGLPGEVDLVAVPEPGTWAALALGGGSAALGGVLRRRRRQRQQRTHAAV